MGVSMKREVGLGEDPRISSARSEVVEEARLVGIWLNVSHCVIVGLLEDRVDYQTIENIQGENEYLHRIAGLIPGAESIVIFGPDEMRKRLDARLAREKRLEKKIVDGGHCVALPKLQLITHVQKFFDQHKTSLIQFYNEQSRSLIE